MPPIRPEISRPSDKGLNSRSASDATKSDATNLDIATLARFGKDLDAAISSMAPWRKAIGKVKTTHDDQTEKNQKLMSQMHEYFAEGNMAAAAQTGEAIAKSVTTYTITLGTAVRGVRQPVRHHLKALMEAFLVLEGSEGLQECLGEVLGQPLSSSDRSDGTTPAGPSTASPSNARSTNTRSETRGRVFELAEDLTEPQAARPTRNGKRSNPATDPDASSAPKRRHVDVPTDKSGTIEYEDLITHPEYQYHILEREFKSPRTHVEGRFWITRCVEHKLHYAHEGGEDRGVYRAAAKHVQGKYHNMSGTDDSVLELLGVAVLNCDRNKADKHNEAVVEAIGRGYQPPTKMQKTPVRATPQGSRASTRLRQPTGRYSRQSTDNSPDDDDGNADDQQGVDDDDDDRANSNTPFVVPRPGNLYLTFWGDDEDSYDDEAEWHVALSIPLKDSVDGFQSVGLNADYETSGLLRLMPDYYTYEADADGGATISLKTGFPELEEGGSQFGEREYPFLCFDRQRVNACHYGWAKIKDVSVFKGMGFDQKHLVVLKKYIQDHYQPPNTPKSLLPPGSAANRAPGSSAGKQQRPSQTSSRSARSSGESPATAEAPRTNISPHVGEASSAASHSAADTDKNTERNEGTTTKTNAPRQSPNVQKSQYPTSAPAGTPTAGMSAPKTDNDTDNGDLDTPTITGWRVLSEDAGNSENHRIPSPFKKSWESGEFGKAKISGSYSYLNAHFPNRGPLGSASPANTPAPGSSRQPGKENQTQPLDKPASATHPSSLSPTGTSGTTDGKGPIQGDGHGRAKVTPVRQEFYRIHQHQASEGVGVEQ